MPVFLLPIIAGGYYYYRGMKEKVRGEPLKELPDGDGDGSLDLASSSIEVSLVMSSQRQQDTELRTILEEEEDDDNESAGIQSQVLHRKESTDTAQTEVSEEGFEAEAEAQTPTPTPAPTPTPTQEHTTTPCSNDDATTNRGILGSGCGGCDQEGLFEFVECGSHSSNSLEKRIAVVFS